MAVKKFSVADQENVDRVLYLTVNFDPDPGCDLLSIDTGRYQC
jgi:hypothetical protein